MSMNPRSQSTCKTKKIQTHLILAGLLFFCSLPLSHSQECKPNIQSDTDFPGSNSGQLYSPDPEHCQKLCTQNARCRHFTYVGEGSSLTNLHYFCFFKFTGSGLPASTKALQGLSSGYSLKPCNPEKLLCLDKLYPNLEFLGTTYTFLLTATREECQKVCTRDPFCQFFTFVSEDFTTEAERYKCHLKYSWSIPRIPSVKTLTGVVSGFSNRIQVHQNFTNACESTFFTDTEIQGNSFESLPAVSAEHCQALCSVHPCCTLFSYDSATFTCHMHNNSDELITQAKVGFKSGLPVFQCLMNDSWVTKQHENVDFFASDISVSKKDDVNKCQQSCNADRNCQFYSYLNQNFNVVSRRKECYLKRVITMPSPDKIEKKEHVVSGFSTNICV